MSKARNLSLLSTVEAGATTDQTKADLNAIGVNSGRKNIIINGGMQVSQRGSSSTSDVDSTYRADRWITRDYGGIGGYTYTHESNGPIGEGFHKSLKLQVSTIAETEGNYAYGIEQRIEGWNGFPSDIGTAGSKSLTASFWVKSSVAGVYCFSLRASSALISFVSEYTLAANTWTKVVKTIPPYTTAFSINAEAGIAFYMSPIMLAKQTSKNTSTTDAWVTGNYVTTANQVNWMASTSNTVNVTGVQLELGSTATDFEHRSYGEELSLCQRYYWQGGLSNGRGVRYAYSTAGSNRSAGHVTFPSTMRTTPTMTIVTTPTYNNCSHNSFGYTTADGFSQAVTVVGTSMYRAYYGVYAADAEL